jgi:hypothetical protein
MAKLERTNVSYRQALPVPMARGGRVSVMVKRTVFTGTTPSLRNRLDLAFLCMPREAKG